MTVFGWLQIFFFFLVLFLLVKPLGGYIARVYQGERTFLSHLLSPLEGLIYAILGVSADDEMDWKAYSVSMLLFNFLGIAWLYLFLRLQGILPLNPQNLPAVPPALAFNTAVSFATNTNWQSYSGEATMSSLVQMLGLTVQNFISAATGMAILIALIRGIVRHTARTIGSFWVDLTRGVLYILLPLSLILSLLLVSQGVVQTFGSYNTATLVQSFSAPDGQIIKEQILAGGPAASQVAIKQLGTNGGGFFNTNSSHPFENPTPLSNFLEMLSILLIPAALCYTFGKMVKDTRQGWTLLVAMTLVLAMLLVITIRSELQGNPALIELGINQNATSLQAGGNMEGKEARFGIINSALWATLTTAASNGSVNSMHDSYSPIGGLVPMWMIQLSEVIFGGVGSGLYGMLAFVLIAVFVSGLLVGRTPEYLGKKIEAFEVKMAALIVLIPPILVLSGTALAISLQAGKAAVFNPGPHGFSEVLYAFSSAANNNGSAFAGLNANNTFYNISLGLAMLIGRYWLAIPTLALAGSLVRKKRIPVSAGTLPTHTPLFVIWLIAVIIIVGALSFFPALALGPLAEQLMRGV